MRTDSPEFRNLVKSIKSSGLRLPPPPGKIKLPEIISFTGIKDADREILSKLNDADMLRTCAVNKKFWNEICDDQFFRRRVLKYPGLESMKNEDETWKQFFLRYMKVISLMKEEYDFDFDYRYPNFVKQYASLKATIGKRKRVSDYQNLLQQAGKTNNFSLAKYAIEKGELKVSSRFFERIINDMEMVRYLIEGGKIENFTSYWVLGIKNLEVLKYLSQIYHFEAEDYTVILSNNVGNTSLEIVKYLVENGADINYRDGFPLRSAVDNFEVVKYLVEKGADVNTNRVLELAAENGNLEIVKFLVENGANKESKNEALLKTQTLEMMKYLVENGADNINVALIEASKYPGGYETVKYLVEKGADIHFENDSALHAAINSRNIKTIKYLVAKAYENGTLKI